MKNEKQNLISLAVIVVAAVVFGMVLSGGLDMTQLADADRTAEPSSAATPAAVGFLAPDFVALADRVIPSVVSVRVTEFRTPDDRRVPNDRFHFFFGPQQQPEGEDPPARRSEGSGFIISEDGEILTNNHVIEDADKIKVELSGGFEYEVEVVGTDPATDLALLKVKDADGDFPFLRLGDSEAVRVGEWVMAAGNPLDMDHTITVGVVSAKGRALGLSDRSFENYIQTDAAINFGNSGGPLVNLRGEVVGINTAINARGQNLGFAVPIRTAQRILQQLRDHGHVVRGYLGVTINNIDQKTQDAFDLKSREGAMVQSVNEDSPAEKAGLTHGDVILKVDGTKIEDTRGLIDTVAAKPPGDKVVLEVIRNGKKRTFEITLGERDADAVAEGPAEPDEDDVDAISDRVGLSVTTLDERTRQMFRLESDVSGVLISGVRSASPAGEEGLSRGDLILEANGQPVSTPADLLEVVEAVDKGGYLRLYVKSPRGAQSFFSILKLDE